MTMILNHEPERVDPFAALNAVNVNGHTEKKNGLTYLSWAWAWAEVKKRFPDATYTVYENKDGWNYHTDGRTCWVKTGVTIEGLEHIEMLPVMDFKNRSITLENVTSMDVNKAIQRSLTKAVARHGLGLYIYAGEDLPEGEEAPAPPKSNSDKALDWCKAHGKAPGEFAKIKAAWEKENGLTPRRVNEMPESDFAMLIQYAETSA
jgi:hypothetical protein